MQSNNISVIIVNWNTKNMLRDCLMSLRDCDDNKSIKVIVVDNASYDGSREMVESQFPEVKVINSGGNIGFARANNLAISEIDTPLVLFLNPDTIVMRNTVKSMADFISTNKPVGAVGCKMRWPDGVTQPLGLQWFPTPITELINILFLSSGMKRMVRRFIPYKNPEESGFVSKLYGGCLMVRREVLDKVGYFDERFFMYGEDVDLTRRIMDAGWKIYYLSEVEIIHLVGGASGKTHSQFGTLMSCESISKLMEKYHGKSGKLAYKMVILFGSIYRLSLLLILRAVSALRLLQQDKNFNSSFSKYAAMFRWSINLEKAKVKE